MAGSEDSLTITAAERAGTSGWQAFPFQQRHATVAGRTIGFGLLLIALGLWGYLGAEAEHRSVTALIPAFLGLALALLGALALKDGYRKHAMHTAALLGTLGFLAAAIRLIISLASGGTFDSRAVKSTGLMALICAAFVGLCVQSFIEARRSQARSRTEQQGS
jgi:Co/Zn/Cd efflux system component